MHIDFFSKLTVYNKIILLHSLFFYTENVLVILTSLKFNYIVKQ